MSPVCDLKTTFCGICPARCICVTEKGRFFPLKKWFAEAKNKFL
jgi:hypothetical protein